MSIAISGRTGAVLLLLALFAHQARAAIDLALGINITLNPECEKPENPDDIEQYCGEDGITYTSCEALYENGTKPLHAGNCGACSNQRDIDLMWATRLNLTKTATVCAAKLLFLGNKAAEECLQEKVGFTEECSVCWIENMACTSTCCLVPCAKENLMPSKPHEGNNLENGSLTPCLQCDEDYCGPAFKTCAGANRRRLGIESDIERPEDQIKEEVCPTGSSSGSGEDEESDEGSDGDRRLDDAPGLAVDNRGLQAVVFAFVLAALGYLYV